MHAHDSNGHTHCLQNRHVWFHICDAYVPEPAQILAELHGQDLLHGRIIHLSDRGAERGAFAVVEVAGFTQPVVVPVAKVVRVGDGPNPEPAPARTS